MTRQSKRWVGCIWLFSVCLFSGVASAQTLTPVPVITTVDTGLDEPLGVAADAVGNIYFVDLGHQEIKQYNLATGTTTILAGDGTTGFSGDGAAATTAEFFSPHDVRLDAAGNIYIADTTNDRIRIINRQSSTITLFGVSIPAGDIQTVVHSAGCEPSQTALDGGGNLYVACPETDTILKVSPGGSVSIFAGQSGTASYTGDNAAPASATLDLPVGVAVDSSGNVYISDTLNNAVRVVNTQASSITLFGTTIAAGTINTIGSVTSPGALVVDAAGNAYLSPQATHAVTFLNVISGTATVFAGNLTTTGNSGDGAPAASALLTSPENLALDSAGTLYISDATNNNIRAVTTNALVYPTPVKTTGGNSSLGFSFTADIVLKSIAVQQSQGAVSEAALGTISGCTVDNATTTTGGTVCLVALSPTPAYPGRRQLSLVITDNGNHTYTMPFSELAFGSQAAMSPGVLNFLGNTVSSPQGLAVDGAGNVFVSDTANGLVFKFPAGGGSAVQVAGGGVTTLGTARGLAVDGAGNLYMGDAGLNVVWKLTPSGVQTTFAGGGGVPPSSIADRANIAFASPQGLAVDGAGNVYIADYLDNVVVKVEATTGVSSPYAGGGSSLGDGGAATSAQIVSPSAMAVDSAGNLYIIDSGNNRVRKVTPLGTITTVAGGGASFGDGGPATSAQLGSPAGLAVDAGGSLYIADRDSGNIRRVDAGTGIITSVAGNGSTGGAAPSGGSATGSSLNNPLGVGFDPTGNLFIADFGNNLVRQVTPTAAAQAFPNTSVSSSSTAQNVTLFNLGNSNLVLSAISIPTNWTQASNGGDCTSSTSLGSGASCLLELEFSPTTGGPLTGTATVTDNSLGVSGATQNVSLSGTAASPPTISTSFGAATIAQFGASASVPAQGITTMSFTITNPVANIVSLSGLSFSDTMPSGLWIAGSGASLSNSCGGAVSGAAAFSQTIGLTGGSLAPGASCIIRVNIQGPNPGVWSNTTGVVSAAESGAGSASNTASITVLSPPELGVGLAASMTYGTTTSLTFTVTNPNAANAISGLAFTDTLGSGLVVSSPNGLTGACLSIGQGVTAAGSATAVAGSHSVSFSGLALAANASCSFSINITATATASQTNSTSQISSSEAGVGGSFSGSTTVTKADQTITFGALATHTYGDAPFTVSASASSTLAVAFTLASGPCSVSGTTVTITGVGTCTINADQAGNTNYNPAPEAQQPFTVNPATLTVTANSLTKDLNAPLPTFTASYTGFVRGDTSAVLTGSPALSTTATTGSPAGPYAITVSAGTLSAPNYTFTFVPGTLTIINPVTLASAAIAVSVSPGTSAPLGQTFTLTYTVAGVAGQPAPTGEIYVQVDGGTAQAVAITSGTATIKLSSLSVGAHTVTSSYSGDGNYVPASVPSRQLTVTAAVATIGAVVSDAGFVASCAPGGLCTIFGANLGTATSNASTVPLQTNVQGVQVLVNGIAAPLLYVSSTQINFQVPSATPTNAPVPVVVAVNGVLGASFSAQFLPVAPAVFTYQSLGATGPVIQHVDWTNVTPTSPAQPGEVLVIWATGAGAVNNQPADGAAAPSSPLATTAATPTVTVGGNAATVQYSGLAPGEVGLLQINVQLPSSSWAGSGSPPTLPLTVTFPGGPGATVNLWVNH